MESDDLSLKGKYMGLCNRSACLRVGANWSNPNNEGLYYCQSCAFKLQDANAGMPYWKDMIWNRQETMTALQFAFEIEQFGSNHKNARDFYEKYKGFGSNTLTRQAWENRYLEMFI